MHLSRYLLSFKHYIGCVLLMYSIIHAQENEVHFTEANPRPPKKFLLAQSILGEALRACRQPRLRRGHLAVASPPGFCLQCFALALSAAKLLSQQLYNHTYFAMPCLSSFTTCKSKAQSMAILY